MALLDIDAMLAPVSEAIPAGENLEYSEVAELERLATGTPGKPDPQTQEIVGGEEPEWRKVRDAGVAVFAQTKDLRAAVILIRAMLVLEGLPGLGQGMQLLARLCDQYWDTVHPRLDADYDDDPVERLNALANLDDADNMIRALRAARIVESREVGIYTVRDLEILAGKITLPEGAQAPQKGLLEAAWRTGDAEANQTRRRGVEDALQACNSLVTLFRERVNDTPNIDTLRQMLKRIKDFYDEVADAGASAGVQVGAAGEADSVGGTPAASIGTGGKGIGALASRADAIKVLEQVAVFVRRTEPSSPAPMFIDRAVKMLQADFATIVKELMPDSRERIELLGGVPLDDPADY